VKRLYKMQQLRSAFTTVRGTEEVSLNTELGRDDVFQSGGKLRHLHPHTPLHPRSNQLVRPTQRSRNKGKSFRNFVKCVNAMLTTLQTATGYYK
jgi:hypothetical protein